jgi:hypothetical protein
MEGRDDLGANPLQPLLALDVGHSGEVRGARSAALPAGGLRVPTGTVLRKDGGCVRQPIHTCDYDRTRPCEACDLRDQYRQEEADTARAEEAEREEQERGE